ncbi:hypothetical protein [Hymenobacter sp. 102]|uniref:hypothetical protein n=1 Tax=Hymenobacter sp. 102 TaxID=3403152 RepID=UPI003CE6E72A
MPERQTAYLSGARLYIPVMYDDDYYGGGWGRNKMKWYGILLVVAVAARLLWEWLFEK